MKTIVLLSIFCPLVNAQILISKKYKQLKQRCEKVGGVYEKKAKCYCLTSKTSYYYINPYQKSCHKKPIKTFRSKVEPKKLKCTLPSSWYCSSETNPHISENYHQKKSQFNKIKTEVFDTFTPNKDLDIWGNLQLKNNLLMQKLMTDENKLLLRNLFNEVKQLMLDYLALNLANDEDKILIKTITNVQLKFTSTNKYDQYSFNSEFYRGNIYIKGHVLLADDKDLMSFILLHELAHAIDPCRYNEFETLYDTHPFKQVLNCLHSKNTVHAQSNDLQCLQDRVDKKREAGEEIDIFSREALKSLKKGSVCPKIMNEKIKNVYEICPMNQINEAFADWLATEVWYYSLSSSEYNNLDQKLSRVLSFLCGQSQKTIQAVNFQYSNSIDKSDTHLHHFDRMNGLLLNHPLYKEINKCDQLTTNYRFEISSIKDIGDLLNFDGYTNYCEKE